MAKFLGSVQGNRSEATRLGSAASGLTTVAASWSGAVRVDLTARSDGTVHAEVELVPWHGAGVSRVLYSGHVDRAPVAAI